MLYTIMPSIAPTIVPEIVTDTVNASFFQSFSFDTLLGCIDCLIAIIGLFVGGAAISRCIKLENSQNDKKEFKDNSKDYSQRAAGDIVNHYGLTETQLKIYTDGMISMSKESFSQSMNCIYSQFQARCDSNLKTIIEKTQKVLDESRIQLSKYTKIDWIHIYFESAKNASDVRMQEIWARVLAKELEKPGTFSYKTLEVLKNLTSNEIEIFEKLPILKNNLAVVKFQNTNETGICWMDLQRMKDFGLINLEDSHLRIAIKAKEDRHFMLCNSHLIVLNNKSDNDVEYKVHCYMLSSSGQEILDVIQTRCSDEIAIKVIDEMKKSDRPNHIEMRLHRYKCESGDCIEFGVNFYNR